MSCTARPSCLLSAQTARAASLARVVATRVVVAAFAAFCLACGGESTAPGPAASVTVAAPAPSLASGTTLQLSADVADANGRRVPATALAWSSSNPLVARVDDAGMVTGIRAGTAEITASAGAAVGRVTLQVVPGAPARIEVAPVADVEVGATATLVGRVTDAAGNVRAGDAVAWQSLTPGVATVQGATLRGIAPGTATLAATAGALTAQTSVTVLTPLVAGVITQNATWTLAGSPYRLSTSDWPAVAHGVTLTIEPGVVVRSANPMLTVALQVFGALRAVGTAAAPVVFDGFTVLTSVPPGASPTPPPSLTVERALARNGAIVAIASGTGTVRESRFTSGAGVGVSNPAGPVVVERNVFQNASGVDLVLAHAYDVTVRHNLFTGAAPTGSLRPNGIQVRQAFAESALLIRDNTFADVGASAFRLDRYVLIPTIDARQNFWGTTTPAAIEQLIVDRADDPNVTARVLYDPPLTGPSPATPAAVRGP